MNVPIPLNDSARDDRFDRGLSRMLAGDPAGIDEIDPELRDITATMVHLASAAGWIDTDPDQRARPSPKARPWYRDVRKIINTIAAVLLIGLISGMSIVGYRIWGPAISPGEQPTATESRFGAQLEGTPGTPSSSLPLRMVPGVCEAPPRSDAEIAEIVRSPLRLVVPQPAQTADISMQDDPFGWSNQTVRNWNACLRQGYWDRAMGYESPYFIWTLGNEVFPDGAEGIDDKDIVDALMERHFEIQPIDTADGSNLQTYSGSYTDESHESGGEFPAMLEIWVVPTDEGGDWIEWPTTVVTTFDGEQWLIVSSTQPGVPDSYYKPDNNLPSPEATP